MYPKSKESVLSRELFQNPTNEYRGAPFWAWNQKLDPETLTRHIDYFREMGIGGFHMHCRTGLDTPYMEEEFKECIKACVEKARKEEMYAYLYDEDRWPSGAAGGRVTKDAEYRSRYLVFTPISNEERSSGEAEYTSSSRANVQGNGVLLAKYDIRLENGVLAGYRRLSGGEEGTNVWYLYEEIARPNPWYNNETYLDTLNEKAVQRFIEETHEQYQEMVGEDFGGVVPSIFTDEPQFSHKTSLDFAESRQDVILPYTDAVPEKYQAMYGADFFETVPELIWDLPEEQVSLHRYRYHDFIAELFASSFADSVGGWCADHGIMLTGHMMEEPTLTSQTQALGEAMRSYRSFQYPGIDMLCDWREYTTAKQAQSATHQYGCPGVLSELYGVTNWDFDFRHHKLTGDWQAALGVTLRVHHLSWDSMNGEAKRDYPASIFYQSPWYREYPLIENHFARVNTALTRGKAVVRIGVVHPVESYWLHYGPKEQTALIRQELENQFKNVTEWLLFSQLDFDFIAESLLPSQYEPSADGKLHVGQMAYDVVLVPGCETIRSTTLDCLERFAAAGGDVLFMGDAPALVDASASDRAAALYRDSRKVGFSQSALVGALKNYREVEIRKGDGSLSDRTLYQLRQDGDSRWMFAANGRLMVNPDVPLAEHTTFRIAGQWTAEEYDTMNGEILPMQVKWENGNTVFEKVMYEQSSLLVKLSPATEERTDALTAEAERSTEAVCETYETGCISQAANNPFLAGKEGIHLPAPMGYRLSEPNVLLLDIASWKLDDGEWQPEEEVLRLDNACRKILGYPLRTEAFAQPWTEAKEKPQHELQVKFTIHSEIEVKNACLALEESETTQITLNGENVIKEDKGYYVDECIRKIALPVIPRGISELILTIPYSRRSNVEWCYLLGAFGVKVNGYQTTLTDLPATVSFGDFTGQGLPFYAGNLTYEVLFNVKEAGEYVIAAEKYRAALLSVSVDGEDKGRIALAPYQLSLGYLEAGEHRISLTAFGNRVNAFGAVHNIDETATWFGPNIWRTTGASFAYEYQLKRTGILAAPRIFKVDF